MKEYLVGYTGFVGSNLREQHRFDGLFNSKNITDAFGGKPDMLVYSGVKAEMFLANKDPEADYAQIEQAISNIQKIEPKQIVLISTVAVYPDIQDVDEDFEIDEKQLTAYGRNRLALERWVEKNCTNHLIVRLPAIFGNGLKKNFIYDYIHLIPTMLTESKYKELSEKAIELSSFYERHDNGFFKVRSIDQNETEQLKDLFRTLGFSALNFTDSRSIYQFYPLSRLWSDIETIQNNKLAKINLVTPPIMISDLFRELTNEEFVNELNRPPYNYDLRTKYGRLWKKNDGYIMGRDEEISVIKKFIERENI